ncbi:hypothetical protein GM418_19855 [Maribellus comscasis]|uniref:Uncharacterized protein n=1 Tax=Maribellus comscasis TaxID=2681766 RepID=A0A6I6JS68_9BACT|nr:hypothetical protein [Maribellus comscasis]QGY45846.1 hypothetical protein GM418_19855 [Maribellus comscasis]
MKSISIIFSMFLFFALSSTAQSKKVARIMDNPETRSEIFNNIMNDHELMLEFMEMMKGNEHATMMMQNGNLHNGGMNAKKGMAETKCNHQIGDHANSMGMMKDNPEMKTAMMEECNANSKMHNMAEMMAQNPEMMKTCMKKMNGMKGENSQINKMEEPVDQQGHEEHHE